MISQPDSPLHGTFRAWEESDFFKLKNEDDNSGHIVLSPAQVAFPFTPNAAVKCDFSSLRWRMGLERRRQRC